MLGLREWKLRKHKQLAKFSQLAWAIVYEAELHTSLSGSKIFLERKAK